MKKINQTVQVKIEKLVYGGQGIAEAADGKKLFVWGCLPGELVNVRVLKNKKSYIEAVAEEVIEASPYRITPKEPEVYLSSSPWQIMTLDAENRAKQSILKESFEREKVIVEKWGNFSFAGTEFGYRNKVELGFWGDENGLHYASYVRGTHGKRIIKQNVLAMDAINNILVDFLEAMQDFVNSRSYRAGDFKTVIFRANQAGEVVAALFTKLDEDFSGFRKPDRLKGLAICYSNPKSPASVRTKDLHIIGDIKLTDSILGKDITYDVVSFFQVNIPVFESVARAISKEVENYKKSLPKGTVIDMYSGVGTIGLVAGADSLVESESSNIDMAKVNTNGGKVSVIHATSEKALDEITKGSCMIVDPPRAGLHEDVVDRILEAEPKKVIYLSCNPSTQARDVKKLLEKYKIVSAQGYNFFPRTPHIESLVVLEKK